MNKQLAQVWEIASRVEVGSLVEVSRSMPLTYVSGTRSVNQCFVSTVFTCFGFRDDTYHFGLRFELDDGIHTGWVRITTPETTGGAIEAWAYETIPGKAIVAGIVPEPSGATMLGLAALFYSLRRRRG